MNTDKQKRKTPLNQTQPDQITDQAKRQFITGLGKCFGMGLVTTISTNLISNNALAFALNYQAKPLTALSKGKLFSLNEMKLLADICALTIPATETPSAADIDTHGFIDNQLFYCAKKAEQHQVIAILAMIEQQAQTHYQQDFMQLSEKNKVQLLTKIEQGTLPYSSKNRADIKQLKALICFGYYTSEIGASHELIYQKVPNGFKGSISYKKGQAGYGSLAYY
ncbi:gluconate 2-dehydrogenase subunit 3 family protein [Litorilituus lipolyticus]|uniref:Gluconate 2-dehydrogenase subunit 3 family protein n=1 Tax=Litorilituus lipolyticus TaxID=2491017 RepID=A0A502L110_9GAMM|nr:gluconate 2-dehydrogenase subunit 3 family protein [Litorilituus lipolyticus]TPH15633.1 gluconate 2-dehydrogenase subunit 3 family protein [Litorilituus lipolyticus]